MNEPWKIGLVSKNHSTAKRRSLRISAGEDKEKNNLRATYVRLMDILFSSMTKKFSASIVDRVDTALLLAALNITALWVSMGVCSTYHAGVIQSVL